jgi:hypothetical protein
MLAKALAFSFNLALPRLLVRRLDQVDFGVYKQLFLIIGTVGGVLPLGFAMNAYYFLPRERERRPEVVFNIVLYNMTVGSVGYAAFLLWPNSLDVVFHQSGLTNYGPLVGMVVLPRSEHEVYQQSYCNLLVDAGSDSMGNIGAN